MIINDERMSDFFSEDTSIIVLDYDGMKHISMHLLYGLGFVANCYGVS